MRDEWTDRRTDRRTDELKKIAFKIGIASDLSNNSKRQVRVLCIAKYYEDIIDDLKKADEERITLLSQISEVINMQKRARSMKKLLQN